MNDEVIHEYTQPLTAAGISYRVKALGRERADGTWSGWLEFSSPDGSALATGQETSQPDREALAYWASGLETV